MGCATSLRTVMTGLVVDGRSPNGPAHSGSNNCVASWRSDREELSRIADCCAPLKAMRQLRVGFKTVSSSHPCDTVSTVDTTSPARDARFTDFTPFGAVVTWN